MERDEEHLGVDFEASLRVSCKRSLQELVFKEADVQLQRSDNNDDGNLPVFDVYERRVPETTVEVR